MPQQLYAYTVWYWSSSPPRARQIIVGATDVDDARAEAARLDPEYLATSTTPRRGRAIETCRFCHRWEPIVNGLYTRMTFSDGISLVCDDCNEKRDDRYAKWQDTEVEVV